MRPWRNNFIALIAIALGALAISALRSPLNERFSRTKVQSDVYALPPPSQVVAMSLGYRSALADLIFAHVLVASGIHIQERRRFEFVGRYIETINELDPKFEAPYRMTDGLLTLQAKAVGPEAYRQARRILERGMREFPFNQALWASAGQFFAYLGPTIFTDPKEQDEWRLVGARTLARACELVGSNENIPHQCVIAAGLLTKSGEEAAARQFLERMLQVNDDPEIRSLVSALLQKAVGAGERDRVQARRQAFLEAWGRDLPFVSRGAMSAIGPSWSSSQCASISAECATSWRAWGTLQDRLPDATNALDLTQSGSR
jgi:hypothetical protein